jgi:hypothetical protein
MPAQPRTSRVGGDAQTRTSDTTSELANVDSPYMTDGMNLYRVVGEFDGGEGPIVGIEDCLSLEVVLLPVDQMPRDGLRPVRPSR